MFKQTLFIYLFLLTLLHAEDMRYDIAVSNTTPYLNEAVFLDINLTQLDHSKVMRFKFKVKKSEAYVAHQIGFKEYDNYHSLKHIYHYLLYPKKSGKISLNFELIKSLTDDDKVAYAISGDRDNVKGLEKEDIAIELDPYLLQVKALPNGVSLVGDFSLTHSLDTQHTDAFEPVYLKAELKGKGNLEAFELVDANSSYYLFKEMPNVQNFHSKAGTSSSIKWDYAISAQNNFSLKEVRLKAFNPKSKKVYELKIPSYAIRVKNIKKEMLLDKENYPSSSSTIDWSWLSTLLSYLIVFMGGFLAPKDIFKRKIVLEKSLEEILSEKIKNAKTHKALLKILLTENSLSYREAITSLESVIYNKKRISLSKIKDLIKK